MRLRQYADRNQAIMGRRVGSGRRLALLRSAAGVAHPGNQRCLDQPVDGARTLSADLHWRHAAQTATPAVENMTCGTCPIVVKKALERVPGVSSTTIDFDKKIATVIFDPDKASSAKLTQATTDAGFPSKVISQP